MQPHCRTPAQRTDHNEPRSPQPLRLHEAGITHPRPKRARREHHRGKNQPAQRKDRGAIQVSRMNYEEKYKQALERAKAVKETYFNLGNISAVAVLESIFPELKSEDEMIKRCIGMCLTDATEQRFEDFNTTLKDCLAWLEKQGEQKPVEQDTETHDLWVYIREWNDKFGRLPKDEDELASCIDYVMKRQKAAWSEKHIADVFEKVGLARIVREQGNDQLTNAVQSAMIELSKQQNPACSEEDRKHIDNIISLLNQAKERFVRESGQFPSWITEILWLEYIKDRIQPQQEWSEYDKSNLAKQYK